jgi:hypothetical protein
VLWFEANREGISNAEVCALALDQIGIAVARAVSRADDEVGGLICGK